MKPIDIKPRLSRQWVKRFLAAGTENGCGDLSIMVGVVDEILDAHLANQRRQADEQLREVVGDILAAADLTPYAEEHNGELVDCSFYQIYKGKIEEIAAKHNIDITPNTPQV